MIHVHDLIDEYEHNLIARWASASLHDGSGSLDDAAHERVALFLGELRSALSAAVSEDAPSLAREREPSQRETPESGLDVLVATRAFGAVHCLLLELAADRGVAVSPAEQLTIASHVNAAIARAAEARVRRQDEDAWRAAHQLQGMIDESTARARRPEVPADATAAD
jgi:hypothetical protein